MALDKLFPIGIENTLGRSYSHFLCRCNMHYLTDEIIDDRCLAFIENLGDSNAVAALEEFYNYIKVPGKMEQIRYSSTVWTLSQCFLSIFLKS